jgi:hypothetical protein
MADGGVAAPWPGEHSSHQMKIIIVFSSLHSNVCQILVSFFCFGIDVSRTLLVLTNDNINLFVAMCLLNFPTQAYFHVCVASFILIALL